MLILILGFHADSYSCCFSFAKPTTTKQTKQAQATTDRQPISNTHTTTKGLLSEALTRQCRSLSYRPKAMREGRGRGSKPEEGSSGGQKRGRGGRGSKPQLNWGLHQHIEDLARQSVAKSKVEPAVSEDEAAEHVLCRSVVV